MKTKVKVFISDDLFSLAQDVNKWLAEDKKKILETKIIVGGKAHAWIYYEM